MNFLSRVSLRVYYYFFPQKNIKSFNNLQSTPANKYEKIFYQRLKKLNRYKFETQKTFEFLNTNVRKNRMDFYLPDLDIVIEIDEEHHLKSSNTKRFQEQLNRDTSQKRMQISYWQRNKIIKNIMEYIKQNMLRYRKYYK